MASEVVPPHVEETVAAIAEVHAASRAECDQGARGGERKRRGVGAAKSECGNCHNILSHRS